MRKPGCIEPVFYFVNGSDPNHPTGYIILAPYTGGGDRCECPTPPGYRQEYADTLAQVDILEKKLYQQEYEEKCKEQERDMSLIAPHLARVRDNLYNRMISGATTQWEKDCIRVYMDLRSDKRKKAQEAHLQFTSYMWARHNDIGDRGAGEEKFNPDRLTVKT